ncbi:hypothetical protein NM688_g1886 [Phlebia brevispora]|uniref:Uncharacterized protein n=1 Tax=Phlebia brevispora TaxID=194682 RepID=A0ACC1TA23_9APHY|nr:hypothetical protein NM688_g1886 [Phlebia brevispora]
MATLYLLCSWPTSRTSAYDRARVITNGHDRVERTSCENLTLQVASTDNKLHMLKTPIGLAWQVPTTFFVDKILPPLREELNLDALSNRQAFRNAVTKKGKLWGYTDKTPAGCHAEDVKAFSIFQRDVHTVVNAIKRFKPSLFFQNNENSQSELDDRTPGSFPDAYFLCPPSSLESVQWSNIAVPGEYKRIKGADSVDQNIWKISLSMTNCMRRDPRRRFVYGFTIEDTDMRLWYFDRSQIIASQPYNFIDDTRTLLHFILSVNFAKDRDQLGWDPTMARVDVDGQQQYDIEVHSEGSETSIYRTIGILSDYGAGRIVGRGTRVWKAVHVMDGEPTGDHVALKDAWVHGWREREGIKYSRIMQSDYLSEHKDLQQHFITVLSHGDVSVSGKPDRTPIYPPFAVPLEKLPVLLESIRDASVGPASLSSYHFQVHYRVVYKEIGHPLSETNSLLVVFQALLEILVAIRAMHKSGWVHRDISADNILLVEGAAKLTDLEYATNEVRLGKPGRTGTVSFLAVEVSSQTYLFRQPSKIPRCGEKGPTLTQRTRENTDDLSEITPSPEVHDSEEAISDHEFHYNPLHDLESLWWNAVYFTLNREVDEEEVHMQHPDDRKDQLMLAGSLFHQRTMRHDALMTDGFLRYNLQCLHPSLAGITSVLEDARKVLRDAYTEAEKRVDTIDFDVGERLHVYSDMCAHFEKAVKLLGQKDVKIRQFVNNRSRVES